MLDFAERDTAGREGVVEKRILREWKLYKVLEASNRLRRSSRHSDQTPPQSVPGGG